MTAAEAAGPLSPAIAVAVRLHDTLVDRWKTVLAVLAVGQIVATAVFFHSVERSGWLVYQGGDQIWLYTTGWLLQGGTLPEAVVGYG